MDPGIGFGKTLEHNLELLRRLDEIAASGRPVVVGTSRKSFLGRITGRDDPHQRVMGTVATNVLAYERGGRIFRVHDVAATRDALAVAAATLRPMSADDDPDLPDEDDGEDFDEEDGPHTEVVVEISGLSLYTHHGVTKAEQEIGQRLVVDLRHRGRRGRRDGHRPDRGHRRLRRGLLDGRAGRPVALVQDARAAVRGDRRPADRRLRRRARDGALRQARAADPAAGRGGLRRALARRGRGEVVSALRGGDRGRRAHGDGRWTATARRGLVRHRAGPTAATWRRSSCGRCAARSPTPARHPRSLTLHYLRPPAAGALEIAVTVERAGRRLSTVTARLEQDGQAAASWPSARSARTSPAGPTTPTPRPTCRGPTSIEPAPRERRAGADRPALRRAPGARAARCSARPTRR